MDSRFSLKQLARDLSSLTPQEHGFTYIDTSRRPKTTGRLSGWILSAKDLNDVAGMPTSKGAKHRAYNAETTDATIAALEDQGALIVGKSSTPELGLRVDTEPVDMPHPVNPLHPGATPGGSSGGAAVQVARGLLRAAHGSDGGGSLRVPAAACGVVGFKQAGTDLGVSGFITRSVADAAFLHDIKPRKAPARIGVLKQPLFAHTRVDPRHLRAVDEAAAQLSAAGYPVQDIAPYPTADVTFESFRHIFTSRLADMDSGEGYFEWVRQQGLKVSERMLADALRHTKGLPRLLADCWQVDATITPMLAYTPPQIGTFLALDHEENFMEQTRWSPWGSLFNVAQLPAISIPWTLTAGAGAGLSAQAAQTPVGVQVGSVTLNDAQLLHLASVLHV